MALSMWGFYKADCFWEFECRILPRPPLKISMLEKHYFRVSLPRGSVPSNFEQCESQFCMRNMLNITGARRCEMQKTCKIFDLCVRQWAPSPSSFMQSYTTDQRPSRCTRLATPHRSSMPNLELLKSRIPYPFFINVSKLWKVSAPDMHSGPTTKYVWGVPTWLQL